MQTTRWSVVLAAGADSRDALASLCESYWYPLYAFLRRSGHGTDDAADLVQGFFAGLLERKDLCRSRPSRRFFGSRSAAWLAFAREDLYTAEPAAK